VTRNTTFSSDSCVGVVTSSAQLNFPVGVNELALGFVPLVVFVLSVGKVRRSANDLDRFAEVSGSVGVGLSAMVKMKV